MAERAGAVVLGPGIGRDEGALEFARGVARTVEAPLLVDADGLNAHAGRLELFRERDAPTVLTPHEGELGRLLERDSEDVSTPPPRLRARGGRAQRRRGAPEGRRHHRRAARAAQVAVSPGGTPALATAGTGDVLSGLIGALLAKGLEAFEAACLGALAHVLAGAVGGEPSRRRPRDGGRRDRSAARRPHQAPRARAPPLTWRPQWTPSCETSWTPIRRLWRRIRRSRRSCGRCASTSCPGVPVVDGDGRCVGIVTEADLVLPDDQGDLHIPHYINLFGGTVFLEPLSRFEERLRKAFASTADDMMTRDPDAVGPDTSVREAAHLIHDSGHNRLPVVEDGRLVGVVTRWTCSAPLRRECRATLPGACPHRSRRDRAQLRAGFRRRALCAVVKADGYGHGAAEAAGAAVAGGADVAGRGHRGRGGAAARQRDRGADARHGRAHARRAERGRRGAEADVVAWTDEVSEARAARARQARHRHGSARHEGPSSRRCGSRTAEHGRADDPLRHRRRAEPTTCSPTSSSASRASSAEVGRDDLLVHAANSAATLRDPRSHFDMVRCGIAIYGMDPFRRGPGARTGSSPRCRSRSWVAAVRRFEPGEAPATAAAGPPPSRPGSPRSRSATATAGGAASPNDCDVLISGRRYPLVGTVSMDNVTVDARCAMRTWPSAMRWC